VSDETFNRWASRTCQYTAAGLGAYWSGLWSFTPSWNVNWKLYGMFVVVGALSGIGGHLRGWAKGYCEARD
jgi:hypothetical protein